MGNQKSKPDVFLVQVNKPGSINVLRNNKYRNENWQLKPRDKAHGKVRVGDLLLIYFAGGAIEYQKQLKLVCKVIDVSEGNIEFKLEHFQEINPPLALDQIREKVNEGVLHDVFLNCGRQGFNICKIDYSDYEKILRISQMLPPASVVVGAESLLEDFIVNNWRPSEFFGKKYVNLELLKDDKGNLIGQQYDTKVVGIIDLLCVDKESGDYVVIEIKKGTETSDQVTGQLARYMGWVKKNLAKNKQVTGIIITSGYDEKLQYAISVIPHSHLAVYEMDFKIKLVNGKRSFIE